MALRYISVTALVILLRLLFVNQAIQGDEIYYLAGAQHAQIEPLHPNNTEYAFLGKMVEMRGHPHPPFNAAYLGLLLWLFGDIREIPFHLAYIPFSLIAAWSCLALAGRWTTRPQVAAMLFVAMPAFVINGGSMEADFPLLAFWMMAIALFVGAVERRSHPRLLASAAAMFLAAMTGYQAALLLPVLGWFLWTRRETWKPAWGALLAAPIAIILWQSFEKQADGGVPLTALFENFAKYGLQTMSNKLLNAIALTVHLGASVSSFTFGFVVSRFVFPLLAGLLLLAYAAWLVRGKDKEERFLAGWILLFFAACLVLFFAGSARYLLPTGAPVAILLSRLPFPRLLNFAVAVNLGISVALAFTNYQHWDGYRQLAQGLRAHMMDKRVWVNGEWGLRYYLEAEGALPMLEGQPVQPGDIVVSSQIYPTAFSTGGGIRVLHSEWPIRTYLPFQLIGVDTKSAYSTVSAGRLESFGLVFGKPIETIRAEMIAARNPVLSVIQMGAPESESQLVSGFYSPDNGQWRWMAAKGVLLLKRSPEHQNIHIKIYLPEMALARNIELLVDGKSIVKEALQKPGLYGLQGSIDSNNNPWSTITVIVDKTVTPANDQRKLGIVVSEIGFSR